MQNKYKQGNAAKINFQTPITSMTAKNTERMTIDRGRTVL